MSFFLISFDPGGHVRWSRAWDHMDARLAVHRSGRILLFGRAGYHARDRSQLAFGTTTIAPNSHFIVELAQDGTPLSSRPSEIGVSTVRAVRAGHTLGVGYATLPSGSSTASVLFDHDADGRVSAPVGLRPRGVVERDVHEVHEPSRHFRFDRRFETWLNSSMFPLRSGRPHPLTRMGLGGLFGIFSCCCLACSSSEPVAFDPAAVDAGHDGDVDAPAIDANDAGLSKRSHFIMIHLEAYHKGPTDPDFSSTILDVPSPFRDEPLGYQRYVWPAVQQLVADADEFGFKLTLAMNPQWSDFILADSTREALVQSWRQVGHELAHHHHPANHPDWNGYTNDASLSHDPLFLGTVSAGYDLVARLVPTGTLRTAMIGGLPEDMPIDSWKRVNGQIVLTSGNQFDSYPDGPEPLAPLRPFEDPKPPELGDPEGTIVVLNHRELGTTNHRTIEEAIEAYQHQYLGLQPDEVFGLVFHGFDYLKARDRILPWFEFVAEEGGSVKTIHEIVATYPYEFDPG